MIDFLTEAPVGAADSVLNALPLPVITIAANGKIADANVAAESFFEASVPVLRRHMLSELVPFGSPFLALVARWRQRGAAVNEYKVDLGTPRNPGERLVDLHVAPLPERPDHVVIMLQERTIADKKDPQLTHLAGGAPVRARARRPAGARNQESALGNSRRRATSRTVGGRRRPPPDAPDLR